MNSAPPASPRRFRLPAAALASALAGAVFLAGCGSNPPTASPTPGVTDSPTDTPTSAPSSPLPTGDDTALYAQIEAQVVEIRGLEPQRDVPRNVLDEDALKERVEQQFRDINPTEYVAAAERLLAGLGLLPADASLEALYIELLGSAVAGFYDLDSSELYVLSRTGAIGPSEQVTFAHEFTHALQDQRWGLRSDNLRADDMNQGDRNLARASLREGDATLLMTLWLQEHLSPEEIQQVVIDSSDPEQLEVLARMPPIIRDRLTFPYQTGLQFALALYQQGGWEAVDDAYERPPASTEQVMHPEKYLAGEEPIEVAVPADLASRMGDGWTVGLEDTLGEFQLGIWLREPLGSGRAATAAAAGWGGDRVVLLDGPDDAWAIGLITEWDTAADATEFADAAHRALDALGRPGAVGAQPGATRVVVLLGSDASVATQLDSILGLTGA